jgi:hypothetical protein
MRAAAHVNRPERIFLRLRESGTAREIIELVRADR